MSESTEMPSEVKQISNFLQGRKQLKEIHLPSGVTKTIINGLMTLIPEEVRRSRILERPELLQTVFDLVQYQIRFNDRLDFEGANKTEIKNLLDETKDRERLASDKLRESIGNLADKAEADRAKALVKQLVEETEFVEKYVRSPAFELTTENALRYRRLVNAIGNSNVTAILMGKGALDDRLKPIENEEMSFGGLEKKYSWMFGNDPKNKLERAVIIMERASTVMQIIDDVHGYQIDKLLGVPSIAAAVFQSNKNQRGKKESNQLKKRFIKEAIDAGLGRIPMKGIATGFGTLQKIGAFVVRSASRRKDTSALLERFPKNLPGSAGVREKAYMTGKLK